MICRNCGASLPDNSIFCADCGCRLDGGEVRPSGVRIKGSLMSIAGPKAPPTPRYSNAPAQPQPVAKPAAPQPAATPTYIPAYSTQPDIPAYSDPVVIPAYDGAPRTTAERYCAKKKKKKLLWLWITLAVLAVGGIVVGVLFLTGVLGGEKYYFLEEAISYDADGEEQARMTVELNDDGLPETITSKTTYEKSDGSKFRRKEVVKLKYDDDGNLISAKQTTSENGIEKSESAVKYDEDGNITEETYYEEGIKLYKKTNKYDQHGNKTYIDYTNYRDQWSSYTSTYEYEYDSDGNVLDEIRYTDGEMDWHFIYEYDDHGNVVYEMNDYCSGTQYNYTYKYEYDGDNILERTVFSDGEETSRAVYEYEDDLIVKRTDYYKGEESGRYEYDYDDNGNLTKMTIYEDSEMIGYTKLRYFEKGKKLTDAQIKAFENLGILNTGK